MILAALLIFGLRVVDVTAATLRILMVMRGHKLAAWLLGFFQALVFVIAIRQVFSDLNNWVNIVGYAAGFATGTVVGMRIEEWLAVGYGMLRIISPRHGAAITQNLRAAGYGVTEIAGRGKDGAVDLIQCSVPRREVSHVRDLVMEIDPQAFISVEDVRPLRRGYWRRA